MRNLVLSPQRLNALNRCPRLYFFQYPLQRTPIEKPKYFTEGEFLHFILDKYYRQRMNKSLELDLIVSAAREKALDYSDLTIAETETLINLFLEYQSFHSNETWEIENSEVPFAKVLLEDEKFDLRIILQGKADLLIRAQSIPIIVDHKKVSQNREPFSRDHQIMSYCWAFNRQDFIINQIGTQKTLPAKDKFRRHYFNVTGFQIDEWIENTIYSAFEAVKFHESKFWPARFSSCNQMGKKCIFYDVCQVPAESWESVLEGRFKKSEDYDIMGEGD